MRAPRIVPLAVTVAALLWFLFGRDYPWQLALLAATAFGALAYVILRTVQNMRELQRPTEVTIDMGNRAPRPAAADEPNPGETSL